MAMGNVAILYICCRQCQYWNIYVGFMRPDSLLRLWRYINHLLTYSLHMEFIRQ